VYEDIEASSGNIVVETEPNPWVKSREDVSASLALQVGLPVGRAAAAKGGGRGKGATGRGSGGWSDAPHYRKGRAVYHGHEEDDDWREEHEDEIEKYDATLATAGIVYLGTEDEYSDDPPPVGRPDQGWDQTWDDPSPDQQLSVTVEEVGWYRVGTKLEAEDGDHNFGWESVDFEVEESDDGFTVDNRWQVSPRI